jgi:hypothetical protein
VTDELNELGVPRRHDLARNQYTWFTEEFDPAALYAAFGDLPRYDPPRGGVKIYAPGEVVPSIKYGEHKWGAFA